eukprot:370731_1
MPANKASQQCKQYKTAHNNRLKTAGRNGMMFPVVRPYKLELITSKRPDALHWFLQKGLKNITMTLEALIEWKVGDDVIEKVCDIFTTNRMVRAS